MCGEVVAAINIGPRALSDCRCGGIGRERFKREAGRHDHFTVVVVVQYSKFLKQRCQCHVASDH